MEQPVPLDRATARLPRPLPRPAACVDSIRHQLVKLIEREPPPDSLNAIYFGLFDTPDEEGAVGIGYYIAGVTRFDPENHIPAWSGNCRNDLAARDPIRSVTARFRDSPEQGLRTGRGHPRSRRSAALNRRPERPLAARALASDQVPESLSGGRVRLVGERHARDVVAAHFVATARPHR